MSPGQAGGIAKDHGVIDAERRPLITYSDGADKAWAAKVEGDYWPKPRPERQLPRMLAALAAMFFLAAFFGGREAAVAALPDLAGLYAALGLPVNLDGLVIEGVAAERTAMAEGTRVSVHATIRNIGASEQPVPPLAAVFYDGALVAAGSYGFAAPMDAIGGGEAAAFLVEFDAVPEAVAQVAIRFRRRGENLPEMAAEWDVGDAAQ
jgi:hypothetical protein